MNAASLIFAAVLVAVANGQCLHALGEASPFSQLGLQGIRKYKTVTTTTYEISTPDQVRSNHSLLNDDERALVRSTLRLAKSNGKVAPKIFLQYLSAHPSVQQYFPAFANVPQSELLQNNAFLSHAYTCMAGLHFYSQKRGDRDPKECPVLAQVASKYGVQTVQEVNSLIVSVLEEELKENFTYEKKAAFEKMLSEMIIATKY